MSQPASIRIRSYKSGTKSGTDQRRDNNRTKVVASKCFRFLNGSALVAFSKSLLCSIFQRDWSHGSTVDANLVHVNKTQVARNSQIREANRSSVRTIKSSE